MGRSGSAAIFMDPISIETHRAPHTLPDTHSLLPSSIFFKKRRRKAGGAIKMYAERTPLKAGVTNGHSRTHDDASMDEERSLRSTRRPVVPFCAGTGDAARRCEVALGATLEREFINSQVCLI